MSLTIFLINGEKLQISSLKKFVVDYKNEYNQFEAYQIDLINILNDATYRFIGDSKIVIPGKYILCIEAKS